jgi:hypothetical protein
LPNVSETHKKVQATRKKEAGIKKQPIIYGRSQEKIMFRVEIVVPSILFNQVEIDGVTVKKKALNFSFFQVPENLNRI